VRTDGLMTKEGWDKAVPNHRDTQCHSVWVRGVADPEATLVHTKTK
jgi:hypothetical protein